MSIATRRRLPWGRIVECVAGAALGLFLCLPLTSIVCEPPTGSVCAGGGTGTVLGWMFHDYPAWLPWAGLLVGGLVGWLVIEVPLRLARRTLA